jgi:hypothetical protein
LTARRTHPNGMSSSPSLLQGTSLDWRFETNTGLLVFALLLIFLGAFTYPAVSVIGVFLLIPAALAPTKRPAPRPASRPVGLPKRPAPTPTPYNTPPASPAPQPKAPVAEPASTSSYAPMSSPVSSSALFPTTMFPSLSAAPPSGNFPQGEMKRAAERGDDVLEVGLLLAVLKLLAG